MIITEDEYMERLKSHEDILVMGQRGPCIGTTLNNMGDKLYRKYEAQYNAIIMHPMNEELMMGPFSDYNENTRMWGNAKIELNESIKQNEVYVMDIHNMDSMMGLIILSHSCIARRSTKV